jgi:hypothetical protein
MIVNMAFVGRLHSTGGSSLRSRPTTANKRAKNTLHYPHISVPFSADSRSGDKKLYSG